MLIEMVHLSRDQRRRRKLAERQRRQQKLSQPVPPPTTLPKDRIAAFVHKAVCEFCGDDGFRHCAYYAMAGSRLVSVLARKLYIPQAGDLQVFCDGDLGMMMDSNQGGVGTGEFHAWIIGPVKIGSRSKAGRQPFLPDMEVIDFSSRHYRRWVETMPCVKECIAMPGGFITIHDTENPKPAWKLADPPDYIWTPFKHLPQWVRVSASEAATAELLDAYDKFEPLMKLVVELWRRNP